MLHTKKGNKGKENKLFYAEFLLAFFFLAVQEYRVLQEWVSILALPVPLSWSQWVFSLMCEIKSVVNTSWRDVQNQNVFYLSRWLFDEGIRVTLTFVSVYRSRPCSALFHQLESVGHMIQDIKLCSNVTSFTHFLI